jgi:hypothetical protein
METFQIIQIHAYRSLTFRIRGVDFMPKISYIAIVPDTLTAKRSLPRRAEGGLYRLLDADFRQRPCYKGG